jgi:predicted subunit of tRNA(5-methylaminomethyl-2-thiouridylate) methyltransferase
MRALPKDVEKGLHELIEDGVPVDEIAYVMGLATETVAEEIEHLAETKEASQSPAVEVPKPRPFRSRGCPYSPKTQIEL